MRRRESFVREEKLRKPLKSHQKKKKAKSKKKAGEIASRRNALNCSSLMGLEREFLSCVSGRAF
jgi:hypothetical protein